MKRPEKYPRERGKKIDWYAKAQKACKNGKGGEFVEKKVAM